MKEDIWLREQDDDLILELRRYMRYEDVEVLSEMLQKYFGAEFTAKLDGPAERVWFFEIEGNRLRLQQIEGYGCFLKAVSLKAHAILRRIEDQWPEGH